MMKLYWSPRSPFVRKTMVAIHELGLSESVEIVPMVVRMDTVNDAMLSHNPLGKIPTLVLKDGSHLIDSFAIIDYLNEANDGALIPHDAIQRRGVLQHHALSHGLMEVLVLWRNERDKPVSQQTPGWLQNFHEKTRRALAFLEQSVPALAGPEVLLSHISAGVVLSYLDYRFSELNWRDSCPALTQWHDDFRLRPSMIATEITV